MQAVLSCPLHADTAMIYAVRLPVLLVVLLLVT
jgi:hypothetical protein